MTALVTAAAPGQLRRARERISAPERWTQGTYAMVWEDTGEIDCECVNGALIHACAGGELTNSGASLCLSLAARARGFETASKFNDAPATTHADVLALLDEAIALAESMLMVPS